MQRLVVAIVANIAFSTIGDVFAKFWGLTDDRRWLYAGLALSLATTYYFMTAIKLGGLAIATTVILLLTIIVNTTIGVAAFHERLTPLQWAGIVMGALCLLLLTVSELPPAHQSRGVQ
jgi:drug/metabolite transporter (DMT)-like permease